MNRLEDLIISIKSAYQKFIFNADINTKGNKAAGVRARKFSHELDKLLKEYRVVSLNSSTKTQP